MGGTSLSQNHRPMMILSTPAMVAPMEIGVTGSARLRQYLIDKARCGVSYAMKSGPSRPALFARVSKHSLQPIKRRQTRSSMAPQQVEKSMLYEIHMVALWTPLKRYNRSRLISIKGRPHLSRQRQGYMTMWTRDPARGQTPH